MGYPENPKTIIAKNKYYPSGLTELDVWTYYNNIRGKFLQSTKNRDLTALIMTDVNTPIIRRKNRGGKLIRLTPQNYDEVITGRTIGFYSAMTSTEEFAIVDIDVDPRDDFRWAKKTTIDVYDFIMDKVPLVRTASIVFTGKTSFHIICNFGKRMKVDSLRFLMKRFLQGSELAKVYTIEAKRRAGVPNIDLSPNKVRGNYITLHSLSIIGLKCMTVEYNQLTTFDPRYAKIK